MANSVRVLHGGSWLNLPASLRSADRLRFASDDRDFNVGFRLVRVSKTPKVKKGDKGNGK